MLIGCKVGVLLGVKVGMAVAEGREVLLGEGVIMSVCVSLGRSVVGAEVALAKPDAVFTTTGLHPAIIANRNTPKAIPAIILIACLLVPVSSFILDDDCLGSLL
jgi:hypothetical protein